jgi:HEAT repeat protein
VIPVLGRVRGAALHRVKLRLAGDDVDGLVRRRDRRRLRWLAEEAEDRDLRFRALRSLAEILDPEAVPLFLRLVEAEAGELPAAVVRTAAEGLGRLLYGDAAPRLRRLLSSERPVAVAVAAAQALASLGRPDDWAAVRHWAQGCSAARLCPDERDALAEPPPEAGEVAALLPVFAALWADKEGPWWTSKAAAWLKSEEPKPRLASDKGADRIVAQAHRQALEKRELDEEEFRRVVLHLGALGRERDQALLGDLLRGATSPGRRRAALQALGLHGDPRSLPALADAMRAAGEGEGGAEQAADLARAAGRLGWREAVPELLGLRRRFGGEAALRSNVAWALGECGGAEAVRAMIDLVRSREEELPDEELSWIARALRRCGVRGREAIRGAAAIAKAGGGERERVRRVAEMAGVP